jgi:hypothetical protein
MQTIPGQGIHSQPSCTRMLESVFAACPLFTVSYENHKLNSVGWVDLNGDGKLDLIACYSLNSAKTRM